MSYQELDISSLRKYMSSIEDNEYRDFFAAALSSLENTRLGVHDIKFLNKKMKEETSQAYDFLSMFYIVIYEFSLEMIQRTGSDYLNLFLDLLSDVDDSFKRVVVGGSGGGRDGAIINGSGYKVTLIDSSEKMVGFTRDVFYESDDFRVVKSDLLKYKRLFREKLAGFLVDSALQHSNHEEVYELVERVYSWLCPGGVILFRLKLATSEMTDHSNDEAYAYYIEFGDEESGEYRRHYMPWTLSQVYKLLEFMESIGYNINNKHIKETLHKDNGVPGFLQILATRPDLAKEKSGMQKYLEQLLKLGQMLRPAQSQSKSKSKNRKKPSPNPIPGFL